MYGETCFVDGHPLVKDGEDGRKCLNEQVTHHFHWPDKTKNSGWVLVRCPECGSPEHVASECDMEG